MNVSLSHGVDIVVVDDGDEGCGGDVGGDSGGEDDDGGGVTDFVTIVVGSLAWHWQCNHRDRNATRAHQPGINAFIFLYVC